MTFGNFGEKLELLAMKAAGIKTVVNLFYAQLCYNGAPIRIEDTVVVQAVDLHVYDTFLRGKAGAAV